MRFMAFRSLSHVDMYCVCGHGSGATNLDISDDDPDSLYFTHMKVGVVAHKASWQYLRQRVTRAAQTSCRTLFSPRTISRRGTVGKASASQPQGPRFEASPRQQFSRFY